ncbi:lipoate--protein ligase family protein [Azospirillum sp. RWY-5-1]|uniref:Lipoate--protein ligase family protein n=1 Tax=Azospirillum oleiclasticum TaxID=2735135 RepID=A0ABX2TE10_9PROT|nr:biotin/lipoate A/B protein ligase family protein [Azospirillum oleiclasticum]NYZ15181.1 lipoate--protein ligase family protein [Azospirillum oleiclasticum]NYZ21398.1 lipoate--protein ligase family protein [Azospirillum oleiclasticum]
MTRRPIRVVDSGVRRPTWHLSASAALAEGHRAGTTPDTLRLQSFPPCALVGRHQILEREVDGAWCAANDVTVARRITGGGAIVMAPGILGWELLLPAALFPGGLGEAAERIGGAVAAGLSGLGVDARFRPRNDVEVGGRKISGMGGWFDGPTLLYQGTVLVQLDRKLIGRALRWPGEKLGRHGAAAIEDRVSDLETLLGAPVPMVTVVEALVGGLADGLGLDPVPGILRAAEEASADAVERHEVGTPDFIAGPAPPSGDGVLSQTRRTPGGLLRAHLKPRPGGDGMIETVLFTGDGFVNPPRTLADLEAALKDTSMQGCVERARAMLAASGASFLGCSSDDLLALLQELVDAHRNRETV